MYDPRMGYHVVIKDFSKKDYKNLIILLGGLGLERDFKSEKRLGQLAKMGLKNLFEKECRFKIVARFKIINYLLKLKAGRIRGVGMIDRIFHGRSGDFQFGYLRGSEFLAGTWRSQKISGEEFVSMILSI